jgi:hypothetical protein
MDVGGEVLGGDGRGTAAGIVNSVDVGPDYRLGGVPQRFGPAVTGCPHRQPVGQPDVALVSSVAWSPIRLVIADRPGVLPAAMAGMLVVGVVSRTDGRDFLSSRDRLKFVVVVSD